MNDRRDTIQISVDHDVHEFLKAHEAVTAVPEIDVLEATALWLVSRGLLPYQFSVATGPGIDSQADKSRLKTALRSVGVADELINFVPDGPDVRAVSTAEWWQIECKGAPSGRPSTHRNSFDRGLASAASYYSDHVPKVFAANKDMKPYLGLALPSTKHYRRELLRRVREPLRRRLNLWVLLYDPSSGTIQAVPPDEVWS